MVRWNCQWKEKSDQEAKKKQKKDWRGKGALCSHERGFESIGAPSPHVLLMCFYFWRWAPIIQFGT